MQDTRPAEPEPALLSKTQALQVLATSGRPSTSESDSNQNHEVNLVLVSRCLTCVSVGGWPSGRTRLIKRTEISNEQVQDVCGHKRRLYSIG